MASFAFGLLVTPFQCLFLKPLHTGLANVNRVFLHVVLSLNKHSCSFCEEQKETLIHLFLTCKYTQNFWKSMFKWISQDFKDLENVSPSCCLCFGLIDEKTFSFITYSLQLDITFTPADLGTSFLSCRCIYRYL